MDYTVLTKVHAVRLYLYASSASREDTVGCTGVRDGEVRDGELNVMEIRRFE